MIILHNCNTRFIQTMSPTRTWPVLSNLLNIKVIYYQRIILYQRIVSCHSHKQNMGGQNKYEQIESLHHLNGIRISKTNLNKNGQQS